MLPNLMRHDHWRLLTPSNVGLKQIWPWGNSIQRILSPKERGPAPVTELIVASDFGGEHKSSTHILYVYLIVASGLDDWNRRVALLRKNSPLQDRTMAYKKLGDTIRQDALVEFLSAASDLDGHLVAIAVDKRKRWLSTQPGFSDDARTAFGLKCNWNPRAFEALMRKVHFLSILLSIWAPPGAHITWITDEDDIVANDQRHDDALLLAGRMSSMYLSQPMGIFRLNTTTQDSGGLSFEDLCAIPDLAAGLLSDVRTGLAPGTGWAIGEERMLAGDLPGKADILLGWFSDSAMQLRKTLISIDIQGTQYGVREIWAKSAADPDEAAQ